MSKRVDTSCDVPLAHKAYVDDEGLHVRLVGGGELHLPLDWFPTLRLAPKKARGNVHVMRPGIGLIWPDIGYELGVGGLSRQRAPLRH